MTDAFRGFPRAAFAFFQALEQNNRTDWFQVHRGEYEQAVLTPAQQLVTQLGESLRETIPDLRYDPRADGRGSLMRIYRDVRFSADKSPLNASLSAILWLGEGKKTERPGFGFRVDASGVQLMAGIHGFPPPMLAAYRQDVLDNRRGEQLSQILARIRSSPPLEIGGEQLARVPRGLPAEHPRADLLRHKGLYLTRPALADADASSPVLYALLRDAFLAGAPLCRWLAALV